MPDLCELVDALYLSVVTPSEAEATLKKLSALPDGKPIHFADLAARFLGLNCTNPALKRSFKDTERLGFPRASSLGWASNAWW